MRVDAEDLAAQPLHRLHLDPSGAAQPAGRLHRAHVTLERLRSAQLLKVLDAAFGCAGLEGLQQRPRGQLGARIGARKRRAPHFTRCRVQALEHRPHLLRAGGPIQPGHGGGVAHEAAR
jgi:hypothetical protein